MKRIVRQISVFLMIAALIVATVGCSHTDEKTSNLPKLAAPQVTVSEDGVASWRRIAYAQYYAYTINNGAEKLTDECYVRLEGNQTIKVKAISGSVEYADSDYSQAVVYVKHSVQAMKLVTPQVTVSANGVASWNSVNNAQSYVYTINDGEEISTNDRTVRLSENQTIKVKAVSGSSEYTDSDFSQPVTYVSGAVQPIKLGTPQVTVSASGVASWGGIDNAQSYIYTINNGAEMTTSDRTVRLTQNQTIRVKAVNSSSEYADSDFSQPVTYVSGAVQATKLDTPQVSIGEDGEATWNVVPNAHSYKYIIDNGTERSIAGRSVRLTANQTIKVKAVSGSTAYTDSDYSQPTTYTVVAHSHTDANSDGRCDTCNGSVVAELSFFAINDLHGKYMDTSNQPGLDEFTTYMKNLYADAAREEILLSSGDMWQGTVESSSNKGRLMTEWMNEAGFVSMTLGNHEYDWGANALDPNSRLAEFPFLAINIKYNGNPVSYCQPSTIVEKGGVKIGIIGAIGDCLSSISGDYTTGLSFAKGSELTALVKAESTRLRNREGCDFIVYSIHEGYGSSKSGVTAVSSSDISYYDTSLSNGYVDLVFEGHTHQSYILRDEYGVYHMQGGGENRYVSKANVSYNTVTGGYTVTPELLGTNIYASSSLRGDPVRDEIFEKYFPDSNPYTTILGTNTSQKNSAAICEKLAELYYDAGVSEWSGYNIVLGGGYLKVRSPYNVAAGNVTYAQLFSILPFDNDVVLGRIQGTYLKSKFLQTSNSDYHVYGTIEASAVVDSTYYYIVVDSYTSTYSSNRITEVARSSRGKYARDLLADFVRSGGWGSAGGSAASMVGVQYDLTEVASYANVRYY